MSGKGEYVYVNGSKYVGDFVEDKRQGFGEYLFLNGNKFDGGFVGGSMEGKGVMEYGNGDRYEGEWTGNKKHGFGESSGVNGDVYRGGYGGGKRNGVGELLVKDGSVYKGRFVDDRFVGPGDEPQAAIVEVVPVVAVAPVQVLVWENVGAQGGDLGGSKSLALNSVNPIVGISPFGGPVEQAKAKAIVGPNGTVGARFVQGCDL